MPQNSRQEGGHDTQYTLLRETAHGLPPATKVQLIKIIIYFKLLLIEIGLLL